MSRRVIPLVAVAFACAAGCGSDSPAAPTQPPPVVEQTRIIAITGDLDFADVQLFSGSERTITIQNQGNAAMSVTSISGSGLLEQLCTEREPGFRCELDERFDCARR